MNEHRERVKQEKVDLTEKLTKLEAFINTDTFSNLHARERNLLKMQRVIMHEYIDVLSERIAFFGQEKN